MKWHWFIPIISLVFIKEWKMFLKNVPFGKMGHRFEVIYFLAWYHAFFIAIFAWHLRLFG